MSKPFDAPVLPTPQDAELAAEASRVLADLKHVENHLRVHLDDGTVVTFPIIAVRLLDQLLTLMAQGNAVALAPLHAELTTQEAADYLNVSRPYLIGLLEKGQIPFRKVGTHRRIIFADLMAFFKRTEEERRKVMDELAAQAQELRLGY